MGFHVDSATNPPMGGPPKSGRFFNYGMMAEQRLDNRYDGHVPALACVGHGGPRSRVFKDGSSFCAVFPDFTNIQESDCGFGDTVESARKALRLATGRETF